MGVSLPAPAPAALGSEALVYHLAEQFGLQGAAAESPAQPSSADAAIDAGEDLEWLRTSSPEETTDLVEVLPAVVALLHPLATQRDVSIETVPAGDLPCIAAHPVAVRQALLNALTVASSRPAGTGRGGAHHGRPAARPGTHHGSVAGRGAVYASRPQRRPEQARVRPEAGRVVRRQPASREAGPAAQGRIYLSALAQRQVLAIDDNAQALQLLQRCRGTRYRSSARDASEARR